MARRSRKETSYRVSDAKQSILSVMRYRAGLYSRLSKETLFTMERDTIGTQITLLKEFAATIPDLEVVEIYVDDDITGTNFERPAYERMMQDVEDGKINCIIVKDLSRFAREHLGAGEYLEKIFPEKGVRFIAITDNIDTLVDDGGIIVPFKNVINERYAKETSVKVAGNFKTMQKNGEFCSWKPIYGYIRLADDKHAFAVDEEAASVVKQIFDWFESGVTIHQICKRLEEAKILCPIQYALKKGYFVEQKEGKKCLHWNPEQIVKILKAQQYCGDMVQNKQESTFLITGVKGSFKYNEKDEWIFKENTHLAIVSREQFTRVQELLRQNAEKHAEKLQMNKHIKNPEYCLSGILKCAHCGASINVKRRVKDGVATYSYICPKHDAFGNARCVKKELSFEETNQLVFLIIKRYMNNFIDMEKALQDMGNSSMAKRKIEDLKMLAQQKEAELRKVKTIKSRLYEDLCGGLLDESDYSYMSRQYTEEIRSIEKILEDLKYELEIYVVQKESDTPVEKKLKKFINSRKLSKAMVDAFINSIVVDNDGRFEVDMKIKDEYDNLFRKMTLCEGGLKDAV